VIGRFFLNVLLIGLFRSQQLLAQVKTQTPRQEQPDDDVLRVKTGPQLSIFQPGLILLCSLTGAALVGLYLLRSEHVRANILDPAGTFQYFVPLMVPCFAFMIERVQHVRQANFFQHGVDFLVFGLAVGRVTGGDVRYVSGHTLLLSYMLVSSKSKIVLIASILVLGQTLYLKYYLWGDFISSNMGLVLGCVLALIVRWATPRVHSDPVSP
jgi:hypothetical protein